MKKTLTLTLLLFAFSLSFSQDFSVTKSSVFKDKKKNSSLSFALEADNGGIITIREYRKGMFQKLKGYYIQCFDSKLKLIKEIDYEVKDKRIENAFLKDGTLHLLEIESKKKEDKISINVSSASLKSLSFSTKELLSFSEDNIKKYFGVIVFPFFINNGFNQLDGNHMGEIVFSENKKFFAINFDFKSKEKETHKIFVYNDSFEKVYDKLIVKDIKDKLFKYNSFEVDGTDGTTYFLGKAYENNSNKKKKKGKINYHYELNRVDKDGEKNISFKTANKFVESLHLVKNKNKLSCVGFYGNDKEFKINGVCLFDLNPNTLEKNFSKFNDFSTEFLNDKYGNKEGRKKRKKDKGIKNIDFKGVYILDNDDIVINAEEFYITTHTSTGANGSISTRTVYHYNDIMSMRLEKNGDLKWARNINKAQVGTTTSSFTTLSVNGSTHFFINCSDKIKKLSADRISFKQTSSKKSNLYVISINENGVISHKKLVDDKDSKVYYKVNNGITNPNKQSVFLLGEKKKNGQILKLKLK